MEFEINTNEILEIELTPEDAQEWRNVLIRSGKIAPKSDAERQLWKERFGHEYTSINDLKF